jgi:GNAT superfamily N-acetyltransferase
MPLIAAAESDETIARCYAVMVQLRPHLVEAEFVPRVKRQQTTGYVLAYVEDGGEVLAVAGFRLIENLIGTRILYVDDLVTSEARRSKGHGAALLEWLAARARAEGCTHLELDCGVQRFDAHRFYLQNRMVISAHHMALRV